VKKVHYALGAVGLAPALGLLATPAAANAVTHAPANNGAKTVSLNHRAALAATADCTGTKQRTTENEQLQLTFWSTPGAGSWACIGTIKVSNAVHHADIETWISNSPGGVYGGPLCVQYKEASDGTAYLGCGRSFRKPLWVHAKSVYKESSRSVSYYLP
jgi:hypothetical protein